MKLTSIKPIFCQFIPKLIEHGFLYISEEYGSSTHLCACGCGEKTVLPFKSQQDDINWAYTNKEGLVTFEPSIGNFQIPCKSHYYIRNNRVEWC